MMNTRPKQTMICAVCGFTLDHLDDRPMHSSEMLGNSDHIAVPIPWTAELARTKCDFCGDETTLAEVTTVECPTFRDPMTGATSAGGWAACSACGDMLAEGDWDSLLERALDKMPGSLPRDVAKAWLGQMYATVRRLHTNIRPYRSGDEDPYTQSEH